VRIEHRVYQLQIRRGWKLIRVAAIDSCKCHSRN
jgi:hypothetical protein